MSNNKPVSSVVFLPRVTLMWPVLDAPRPKDLAHRNTKAPAPVVGGPKPEIAWAFMATLILPPEVPTDGLVAAANAAMLKKCGKLLSYASPIHANEEKAFEGFMAGGSYFAVTALWDKPPQLVDRRRSVVPKEGIRDLFYSGTIVNAWVNAYVWSFGQKQGYSYGLQGLQFVEHGERIGRVNVIEDAPMLDAESDLPSSSNNDLFS